MDFIDRVRDAANIEELAGELTQLSGRGSRLTGCCPFHTEDTPSFVVYIDSNSWHCFGCGRGGSVFDLVMERDSSEFWEAVTHLAGRYNIPLPEMTEAEKQAQVREKEVQSFLEAFVAKSREKLAKHPEVIDYLHSQGITDQSIEEYHIGYGVKLSTSADKALASASGLVAKSKAGNVYQPMLNRIIFPVRRGGKVVQISGRFFGDGEPKYMSLPGRDVFPWNSHRLKGERVILVEGAKDAILLEQAGFPACATIAISAKFKPEWLKLVGKDTECYACHDADDSGAGDKANEAIAERLFDAGHKAFVIQLPEGHDPASFVLAEGAGAFQSLLDRAKSYIDYLIDRLPVNLNSYDLPRELERIYSKVAKLPVTSHERYIDKLAKRLDLGKVAVRKELREYIRDTHKRSDESAESSADEWKIRRRATNPVFFNSGQDVIKGTLFYTIHFEIEGMGIFKPFVITSNKDCYPLTKEELLKRDMINKASAHPSNFCRWSIGTDNQFNALDYLDGKTHVDPKDLYTKIKWYFKKFVWFPDPFYYDFLTCWTIATYHFRLYDSFGYIFINAMKRSGKTQTLSLLSHLCFNASMADALTEAVLKRRVNVDASTIIADEAEFFKAKMQDERSMVFEVFNGGYKRTGRATMVDPDSKAVEDFCTYSPKALANTQGLYDVLADRCIILHLLRSERSIPEFVEADHMERLQKLRDMLYCFSLEYISEIIEVKRELKPPDNLPGRDRELWFPVLVTAAFLDNYQVVEPEEFELSDGTSKTISSLYERMVTMAIERREYRKALEEDTTNDIRVMQAIWSYITENPDYEDFYSIGDLCNFVKEELGWDKYYSRSLTKYIFDTTKLAKRNSKNDRKDVWDYSTGKKRKIRKIRITRKIVQDRARQLFGIDLSVDEPVYDGPAERDPFEDD